MRHIDVQVTMTWLDFNFWEGAKDTVNILIDFDLINTVWDRLAERIEDNHGEVSETDIKKPLFCIKKCTKLLKNIS